MVYYGLIVFNWCLWWFNGLYWNYIMGLSLCLKTGYLKNGNLNKDSGQMGIKCGGSFFHKKAMRLEVEMLNSISKSLI